MDDRNTPTDTNDVAADLVIKYQLPAELIAIVGAGKPLEFLLEYGDHLQFEIPSLRDHDSSAILKWWGSDPTTWHVEGIRFEVVREWDEPNSPSELFTPDSPEDVDGLLGWLELNVKS